MTKEKYEPTQEEVKKAESMLLPSQERITAAREAVKRELDELGLESVPPDFRYSWTEDWIELSGTFNGVFIDLTVEGHHTLPEKMIYAGEVDGLDLDERDASRLYRLYERLANSWKYLKDEEQESTHMSELEEERKEGVVKDKLKKLGLR